MPEIGMSVSMSGDGKRGVGHRPQATAPILDSTEGLAALAGRRVRSFDAAGAGAPLTHALRGHAARRARPL
jgi:hypothetical protein